MPLRRVIAVHGGAGDHPEEGERAVRHALRSACKRALDGSSAALDAVADAVSVLEDDPALNAGYGSNLTVDGTVECDAALMAGDGAFGSVGAVGGVRAPVRLARAVLDAARVPSALGRVPPLTLVGEGARRFAREKGVQLVEPETLVAPHARDLWEKWSRRLAEVEGGAGDLRAPMQDTVGAVACVEGESLAAAVSSGGILLKLSGRLGEAAVYGAGCWAAEDVACSVSGTGEDIVRTSLARTIAETIMARGLHEAHDALHHVLTTTFCEACFARGEWEPSAGALVLVREPAGEDGNRTVRLWCAFTTPSMAVGYASSSTSKPKAVILRRPSDDTPVVHLDGKLRPRLYITALPLET